MAQFFKSLLQQNFLSCFFINGGNIYHMKFKRGYFGILRFIKTICLLCIKLIKTPNVPIAQIVPLLDISIDGWKIWPLAGKAGQKSLNIVSGLKIDRCIDGCMHKLHRIDGCSCTHPTRTNKNLKCVVPFFCHVCDFMNLFCRRKSLKVHFIVQV